MSDTPAREVDPADDLFRCLTTMDWWDAKEGRPSTAALRSPQFCADAASIAQTPDYTLRRFPAGCGLIRFNYGTAKAIGYSAHHAIDPDHPDNAAHVDVFNAAGTSGRKTMARRLIDAIMAAGGVAKAPNLPPPAHASK